MLLTALILVVGAIIAWFIFQPNSTQSHGDAVAATRQPARRRLMDRFEYAAAAQAFQEAVDLDPGWLLRINLASPC